LPPPQRPVTVYVPARRVDGIVVTVRKEPSARTVVITAGTPANVCFAENGIGREVYRLTPKKGRARGGTPETNTIAGPALPPSV